MISLNEYIINNYGSQKAFALSIGTPASNVSFMVRRGYVVMNNQLFSPKRKLPKVKK